MTKEKTKKKKGLFSSLKNAVTGKSSKKDKDGSGSATAADANTDAALMGAEQSAGADSSHAEQIAAEKKGEKMEKAECLGSPAQTEGKTGDISADSRGASTGTSSPELTLDLDAVGNENHLSNDAALHKLAVAPKQKHPPSSPRTRSNILDGEPCSPSSVDAATPGTPDSDNDLCATLENETVVETNAELTDGVKLEENNACGSFLLQAEFEKPKSSNPSQFPESTNHFNHDLELDYTSSFGTTTTEISKIKFCNGHHNSSSNGNNPDVSNTQIHETGGTDYKFVNKTPEVSKNSPTVSRIPERRQSKIPKLPPSGNSLDSPSEKKPSSKNLPLSLAPSPQNSSTFTRQQSANFAKTCEPENSPSSTSSPSSYLKSSSSASGIPKLVLRSGIPRPRESKEPEDPASLETTAKTKSSESISQQFRKESFEHKRKGSLKSQIPKLAAATHIA